MSSCILFNRLLIGGLLVVFACTHVASAAVPDVYPLSDPSNRGGWVYNSQISDEFNDKTVDEDRWFIVGKFENGKPVYRHPDRPNKKVWKGRAPSQFSGRNHRLEDGMLKLEARWEPDFPFEKEIHKPVFGDALPYENITTPCFIGRREFKYGYIEIRSKAADTQVSSAFWSMGKGLEFDFYEQFGDGRGKRKDHLDRELWWSVRDWSKLKGKPTYTERKDLGFRVADDFHVYGVEWNEKGLRYFIDGKLFSRVPADKVRAWAKKNRDVGSDYDGWVAVNPISLWLDMETFPWHGVPKSKADLEKNSPPGKRNDGVVDYEVDYVRVWQTKQQIEQQLEDPAEKAGSNDRLLGFEPPGNSQDWWITPADRKYVAIVDDKAAAGKRSLRFATEGPPPKKVTAFAPYGSLDIDAGPHTLSMQVFVAPEGRFNKIEVVLEDPFLKLKSIDLSEVPVGEWVTVEQKLRRRQPSGSKDRVRLFMTPKGADNATGELYVDQLTIKPN